MLGDSIPMAASEATSPRGLTDDAETVDQIELALAEHAQVLGPPAIEGEI